MVAAPVAVSLDRNGDGSDHEPGGREGRNPECVGPAIGAVRRVGVRRRPRHFDLAVLRRQVRDATGKRTKGEASELETDTDRT